MPSEIRVVVPLVTPDEHFNAAAITVIQTQFGLSGASSDTDLDQIADTYSTFLQSLPHPITVIALRDYLRYLRADLAAEAGDDSLHEAIQRERNRCGKCGAEDGASSLVCPDCGAEAPPF